MKRSDALLRWTEQDAMLYLCFAERYFVGRSGYQVFEWILVKKNSFERFIELSKFLNLTKQIPYNFLLYSYHTSILYDEYREWGLTNAVLSELKKLYFFIGRQYETQ